MESVKQEFVHHMNKADKNFLTRAEQLYINKTKYLLLLL